MKPANAEKLVDTSSIQVDPSLPYEERVKSYLSQIGNPYRYLGDYPIICVNLLRGVE